MKETFSFLTFVSTGDMTILAFPVEIERERERERERDYPNKNSCV